MEPTDLFADVLGTRRGSCRDAEEAARAEVWRLQVLAQGQVDEERNWALDDDSWCPWDDMLSDGSFKKRTRVLFACDSECYDWPLPGVPRRNTMEIFARLGVHVETGCWVAATYVLTNSSIIGPSLLARGQDLDIVLAAADAELQRASGNPHACLPRRRIERELLAPDEPSRRGRGRQGRRSAGLKRH